MSLDELTARRLGADLAHRVDAFAADMRAQEIHVGLGSPARCVVCDVPFPCSSASPPAEPPCLNDAGPIGH